MLAALALQGVVVALTALSSGYDDYAVLRVSGGMGLINAIVLVALDLDLVPALLIALVGPFIALLVCLTHSSSVNQLFSRGPFADLMSSRGCLNFENASGAQRGRSHGRPLSKILCGERFESAENSGGYIASTVLVDGSLYDVNLQSIIGWMPRDPWVAVLTEEEMSAIRFAMRPAPAIEELLAAKVRGDFLVHDPFGETNLRSYLVANHPDLLVDPELHADAGHNPLQERIRKTEKTRAMQWAWTVVVGGALPMVFAWAALAGDILGRV